MDFEITNPMEVFFWGLFLLCIPIALFDSLDPLTFAVLFYISNVKNPVRNSLYFILAYMFSYWASGVFYTLLGDKLLTYFDDSNVFLVFGIIFIFIGISWLGYSLVFHRKETKSPEIGFLNQKKIALLAFSEKIGGLGYIFFGIVWMLSYIPFAYPLMGVVVLLAEYHMEFYIKVLFLFIYSVCYIIPYIIFIVSIGKLKQKYQEKFEKFQKILSSPYFNAPILIFIGILLI